MTKTNRTAAEKRVAAELKELPEQFLICRDLRHSWEVAMPFTDVTVDGLDNAVERTLRCARCGTRRTDLYIKKQRTSTSVRRLVRVRSTYAYPKHYQMRMYDSPPNLRVGQLVRYETFRRALNAVAVEAH